MDTKGFGWFEPVETPTGWVYALRPDDRAPVPGASRYCGVLAAGLFVTAAIMLGVNAFMGFRWDVGSEPFVQFSVVLGVAGSCLLFVVVQMRRGRDELRLDARAIRATRRIGPLSWGKNVRRSKVARLAVVRKARFMIDRSGRIERSDFFTLATEDRDGRRIDLIVRYPRELLLTLAADLSSRWQGLSADPDPAGVGLKKVAVGEESDVPSDVRERTYAPPGTRLVFERQGEHGLRMTVPPGVSHSRGFLVCLLAGVLGLVAAVVVFAPLIDGPKADLPGIGLALLVVLGVYSIIGIVNVATTGGVVVVTPDSLTQEMKGVFGTWSKSWERSAIRAIRAETKVVNDGEGGVFYSTRILIYTTPSIKSGPDELELTLPKPELEWIATTLRGVLGVPSSEAPTDAEIRAGLVESCPEGSPGDWLRELGD